jgi:hypothetical protein
MQTVRCERCFSRGYILRTVPVLERVYPESKQSHAEIQIETKDISKSDDRVA